MSLLTYAEVRPWARSMKTKVTNREMPPWHIDRSIGEYSNDVSLSDQEVATIAAVGGPRCASRQPRRRAAGESVPAEHRVDLRRT